VSAVPVTSSPLTMRIIPCMLAGAVAVAQAQDLLTVLAGIKEARDFFNRINNDPILKPILEGVKNATILAPLNTALVAKAKGGNGGSQGTPADILARAQVVYHILDGIYPQNALTKKPIFIPTYVRGQGGDGSSGGSGGGGVSPSNSTGGAGAGAGSAGGEETSGGASDAGLDESFLPGRPVPANISHPQLEGAQVVKGDKDGKTCRFTGGLNQIAKVVRGDIKFDGGVIHLVDHVLPTPQTVTDTLRAANLTQLLGAIQQTGLHDLFDRLPNVTIFAPRNESFNKIASVINSMVAQQRTVRGTVKQLDTDLANIVRYGVGQGVYYSTLLNNLTIPSLLGDGQGILSTLLNGNGFINSAKAVSTDLLVNNGVIHVIDNVLNPDNVTGPSNDKHGTPMFANASSGHANLSDGANNKPIPLPVATPITPEGSPTPTPTPSPIPTPTPAGGGAGSTTTKTSSQGSATSTDTGPFQTNAAAGLKDGAATAAAMVGAGAMLFGL
ncbi:hypothetical protein KEM52_001607, partial [Ascosphaera acerosa]